MMEEADRLNAGPSIFEWPDSGDNLQDFPYMCHVMSADPFTSLTADVPDPSSSHKEGPSAEHEVAAPQSGCQLSVSLPQSSEDFFQSMKIPDGCADYSMSSLNGVAPLPAASTAACESGDRPKDPNETATVETLVANAQQLEEMATEWCEIGGAAALYRALPDGLKDMLVMMKIPEDARRRKFLTVREMVNIKRNLKNLSSVNALPPVPGTNYTFNWPLVQDPEESPLKRRRRTIPAGAMRSYLSDDDLTSLSASANQARPNSLTAVVPQAETLPAAPAATGDGVWPDFSPEDGSRQSAARRAAVASCSSYLPVRNDAYSTFYPPAPSTFQASSASSCNSAGAAGTGQMGSVMARPLSPRSRQVFDFVSYPAAHYQSVSVNQRGIGGGPIYPESYSRPRHFDFRSLQIGNYEFVPSDCKTSNRLNRLKVIFTTQKFVYEYELAPKNAAAAEKAGQVFITRMISIEVPFSTVIGIDCCDTVMRLLVDTEPFVFIGYRTHYPDQSRNCVYERMADNDLTNGEMSTSPLHRLVLMRPESANKLRYHLGNFSSRFAHLLRLPFPAANHVPHWPLRQQNIFTIPSARLTTCSAQTTQLDREGQQLQQVQHSRVQLELMQRQSDQIQRQQQQQYEEQHQRLEQQELLMQYRQCLQYGQPVEAERGVSGGTGCCTCKVGCRSKRCSCARQGKACHPGVKDCRCTDCDNPLNLLFERGVDLDWVRSQSCMMDNIFHNDAVAFKERLGQCVTCPVCSSSAILTDILVAGSWTCGKCLAVLRYSWCKSMAMSCEGSRWRHCKLCFVCQPADFTHCKNCETCVQPQPDGSCLRCKYRATSTTSKRPNCGPLLITNPGQVADQVPISFRDEAEYLW